MYKKFLFIFGTRPEAIKMIPVIKILQQDKSIVVKICTTGQHRQMLDQVLTLFDLTADYDLNIMQSNQDLFDITTKILLNLRSVLETEKPDLVFVHGDTTTTLSASLAAYYKRIKIAHIEAGLRTNNLYSPWPEEGNRQLTGILADYHFAPTLSAASNLEREGKNKNNIVVTGNTVIDSLFLILEKINNSSVLSKKIIASILEYYPLSESRQFILVTGHRRENFGQSFINICNALKRIAKNNPTLDIVYPVHLNPNVQGPVYSLLSGINNIYLIPPLEYEKFVYLMSHCYFVITDSGGIQEEAPALGKPVLVIRDTTERPEGVEAGTVKLVGTEENSIYDNAQQLIDDINLYKMMAHAENPYGNGHASEIILDFLKKEFANGDSNL